jgi:protein phosphatase/serine/threonine-protein phosphatase Stp1
MQRYREWAVTHAGATRTHNEDAMVCRADLGLWAVADGAGGHQMGEVASAMIADALRSIPASLTAEETLTQVRMRVSAAHHALHVKAAEAGEGSVIASTVVVMLARNAHFACLWAGDSRAYRLRAGRLSQITRDHSLVQELVDAGAITQAAAESHPQANVITRAVGAGTETLELDKVTDRMEPGDRFLLCSDGLCKTLDEKMIETLLAEEAEPAAALVDAALAARVRDNVTAVVLEVVEDSAAAPAGQDAADG